MLKIFRRLLRRDHGVELRHVEADPTVSRAGPATCGMRPGDASRFRPSQGDRDLAAKLGTTAYDAAEQRR